MNPGVDTMNEMVDKNECLRMEDGFATVRPSVIRDRLDGKLSKDDCEAGHLAILDAIKLESVRMNLCASCADLECSESSKSIARSRPRGSKDAKVMFINKMPSMYETATGSSYSDEKGIMISVILSKMKINLSDVYFTDFIKCMNSTLTTDDINHCAKCCIMKEVEVIKPKIIIGNGLAVLRMLNATGTISGLPDKIQYGIIYDVVMCNGLQTKVMGTYDIERVLMKEGDELTKCKGQLWQQLCSAFNVI